MLSFEDNWDDDDYVDEKLVAEFSLDEPFVRWIRLEFESPFIV